MSKKIDLTLLKSLVKEFEISAEIVDTMDVDKLSKDDGTLQRFVAELAKAYGSAVALSMEATGLSLDALQLLKVHGLKTAAPVSLDGLKTVSYADAAKSLEDILGLAPPATDKPKPGGSFN